MRKQRSTLAASLMAFGLVATACTSKSTTSTTATTAATTAASADATTAPAAGASTTATASTAPKSSEATTTVAAAGGGDLAAALAVAQKYVGGKAGAASGDPLVIGYVNSEGGTPSFPDATIGAESAVKFVNEKLGGAGGHPIQLKKCIANTAEDGTKCAQEMLADAKVSVVLTGALFQDAITQPFLDALKDQKPVIIGNPVTTPEFLATDAFAFTPGSPGVVQGMAVFAAKYLPAGVPKSVAVVYSDNSAGQAAYNILTLPVLNKLGITDVKAVPIPDTAGPQDFAPALTAAGGEKADVIIPLVTVQGCIGTAQALKDLGIKTPVVTTGLCFGTPMTDYLKQQGEKGIVPNNWYFGGYGYSYYISGDPNTDAYITMIKQYATDQKIANIEYTGFAGPDFGSVLTLTKFANDLGGKPVTPDAIRAAAKAFTGPQWNVVGPMKCGASPIFKSLCGLQMGIQQYVDTKWISVRDGLNGKPIDPSVDVPA